MNIITQKSNIYGDSTYAYDNHQKIIFKEKISKKIEKKYCANSLKKKKLTI
jgi:hypothetical protein